MNVLHINGKVNDLFSVEYVDEESGESITRSDYPFGPFGSGDYINLIIDNDTGQILNWVPITLEMMKG